MTKDEIIEQLEKLGYEYRVICWADGTIKSYDFICIDHECEDYYWKVSIEDHTRDSVKDWLIYVGYYDYDEQIWGGTPGCVEFEAMKLIVEFVEILKKEKQNAAVKR